MGQQASNNNLISSRSYKVSNKNEINNKRIQHQGILKLRAVPFKNCIQINSQTSPLFLQNVDITLSDLLDSRLYTNKLFPKQDIQRLIENLTYTLAFLQQNGIAYKDLKAQNVYYDDQIFKILPNQLIPNSIYSKFLTINKKGLSESSQQRQFIPLSPQMIIAFRCKQHEITDMQILDKSNVFYLGLLLLQVTTLLPSFQCYDKEAYQILDQIVSERIQLVKEYYSEQIASIVANMLDYDYVERMNLKQMSIFVNRQINKDKISQCKQFPRTPKKATLTQLQNNQSKASIFQAKNSNTQKSRISINNNDDNQSQITKNSNSRQTNQKRKNKSNKIYMYGVNILQQQIQQDQENITKQQRNKVYMKNPGSICKKQPQSGTNKIYDRSPLSQKQITNNINHNRTPSRLKQNQVFAKNKQAINNQTHNYQAHGQIKKISRFTANNEYDYENSSKFDDSYNKNNKNKNNNDYSHYRANNTKQPQIKAFNKNKQNYPGPQSKIYDFRGLDDNGEESEYSQTDRNNYYDQPQRFNNSKGNNQGKDHESSLHRIKSQIQRSRKLIQQFKKGQNSHY